MVTAAELIIVISAHIYFFLFATPVDVYFNAGCNVMIRNDNHIVFRRLPRELLREAQRLAGDPMQWMRKLRLLQIWTSHSLQEMPLEQTPLRLSSSSLCQQV